jgi:hypothetical protein
MPLLLPLLPPAPSLLGLLLLFRRCSSSKLLFRRVCSISSRALQGAGNKIAAEAEAAVVAASVSSHLCAFLRRKSSIAA